MFNETAFLGLDPNARIPTCGSGEIASDVGGDNMVCLSQKEWEAFEVSQSQATKGGPGAVNVNAGGLDLTTVAIYGGIGFLVLMMFMGGRKR